MSRNVTFLEECRTEGEAHDLEDSQLKILIDSQEETPEKENQIIYLPDEYIEDTGKKKKIQKTVNRFNCFRGSN